MTISKNEMDANIAAKHYGLKATLAQVSVQYYLNNYTTIINI